MKLTVLVDNNTLIDQYYLGEPGLSFHIQDGEKSILFDTGYSDIVTKNAKSLNIDLSSVSDIVISHGHNDHTGGLYYLDKMGLLQNKRIVAHPLAFEPKFVDSEMIGSPLSKKELNKKSELYFSKVPIKITNHITFLGEIPRTFDFENRKAIGVINYINNKEFDYVLDDTALVFQNEMGLFIISGCSHSGICNIIEYAKKVCNEKHVLGVIGGFHLFHTDNQLMHTINYMKTLNMECIYPCHCVSLDVKSKFKQEFTTGEIGVSSIIII